MEFIADLHLHSRFSRATAKNLNLEHLYQAAQLKGITLVGTGDFTHPEWVQELSEKLEPAEDGLFRLKDEIVKPMDADIPKRCRKKVRFILQCEISSIYKKADRVRKNHNLIFFPDLETVRTFNARLNKIGNITSDGRPILGLDAEKLLEIMLETSSEGFLIPAHIWTPWFSMFGSKSGFDSIEACFGSLSHHIFAVETGLSSDPPMNWRVADLDRISLISSSDAHSPMMMGRNASRFDTELSFFHVRDALKAKKPPSFQWAESTTVSPHGGKGSTGSHRDEKGIVDIEPEQKSGKHPNAMEIDSEAGGGGYLGTIDMYPEEGKYHFDGHRNCQIVLHPAQTRECGGICPACGKPLTLGVLYRVQALSSRDEGYLPERCHGFKRIVPLAEILSELCGVGPKTKKVTTLYNKALEKLGPELDILMDRDLHEIDGAGIPLLTDAMERLRSGKVHLNPGYDGEFGSVKLFSPDELERLKRKSSGELFPVKKAVKKKNHEPNLSLKEKAVPKAIPCHNVLETKQQEDDTRGQEQKLNPEQRQAIDTHGKPLLMEAGPGTGKTHTLTEKIVSLIVDHKIDPGRILALTFTNKAADEMRTRITNKVRMVKSFSMVKPFSSKLKKKREAKRDETTCEVTASTFHGFCLDLMKEYSDFSFAIADDPLCLAILEDAVELTFPDGLPNIETGLGKGKRKPSVKQMAKQIHGALSFSPLTAKEPSSFSDGMIEDVEGCYRQLMRRYGLIEMDDLVPMALALMEKDHTVLKALTQRFSYLFVDEYQDVNQGQYQLIRRMAGDGRRLCVIGDPDQSIYGFRGSDHRYFNRFQEDYADTRKIVFKRNYRSSETILRASFQLISGSGVSGKEDRPSSKDGVASNRRGVYDDGVTSHDRVPGVGVSEKKERLHSDIEGAQHIQIMEAPTERAEAVMIGKTIEALVGGLSMLSMDAGKVDTTLLDECSFSDIAVLYRTKQQSEMVSSVLEKAGIPCQTADRDDLFSMPGIRELISFIRISSHFGTFHDLEILMNHLGLAKGKKTRLRLKTGFYRQDISPIQAVDAWGENVENRPWINKLIDLFALSGEKDDSSMRGKHSLRDAISATPEDENRGCFHDKRSWPDATPAPPKHENDEGYFHGKEESSRSNNVSGLPTITADLIRYAMDALQLAPLIDGDEGSREVMDRLMIEGRNYTDPRQFHDRLTLKRDPDIVDDGAEKVKLMTMHAAKGLEFKVVFVAGCDEGIIPYYRPGEPCENLDEERRLFYVAMTRAKSMLYLCNVKKRMQYGKSVAMKRSRFLNDIEETLKAYQYHRGKYQKKEQEKGLKQLDLF